ncbi:hypothetical protein OG21DRAFT_792821 [Imleria badia]|nr:hypothetical protein OG21DRAFT_792821 [Imleria badia]
MLQHASFLGCEGPSSSNLLVPSHDHPGIPPSPAGFGEHHCDEQLNATKHHYYLCGDRSLSIGLDHLRIRVIFLEIGLAPEGRASYKPVPLRHSASVGEATPLYPQYLSNAEANTRMTVGVIDYGWTGSLDEGILGKSDQYFCFLLHKSSQSDGRQKVLTKKVVFLSNGQELTQELACSTSNRDSEHSLLGPQKAAVFEWFPLPS